MTTTLPVTTSILDVLKKKMRQTKEELERYKDECEEYTKRLQLEALRREEVSTNCNSELIYNFTINYLFIPYKLRRCIKIPRSL